MSRFFTAYTDAEVLDILWRHRVLGQPALVLALSYSVTRSAILGLVNRIDRALAQVDMDATDDAVLLWALEYAAHGIAFEAIGRQIGLSRLAALGLVHALRAEAAKAEAPGCQAPGQGLQDGTLPAGWWAKGLDRRAAA